MTVPTRVPVWPAVASGELSTKKLPDTALHPSTPISEKSTMDANSLGASTSMAVAKSVPCHRLVSSAPVHKPGQPLQKMSYPPEATGRHSCCGLMPSARQNTSHGTVVIYFTLLALTPVAAAHPKRPACTKEQRRTLDYYTAAHGADLRLETSAGDTPTVRLRARTRSRAGCWLLLSTRATHRRDIHEIR